jgi:hypothetical protein
MQDLLERLIIRHGFPGLPASITTIILFTRVMKIDSDVSLMMVVVFASLTVLFGYICFQFWFYYFEREKGSLAYNSKHRKVLIKIQELLKNDVYTYDELYSIWETVLYRKGVDDKRFDKDKKLWSEYHLNMAMRCGTILGLVIVIPFLALFVFYPNLFAGFTPSLPTEIYIPLLSFFMILYLFAAVLFRRKALQTRKLVETLEVFWVSIWLDDIKKEDEDLKKFLERSKKRKNV